MAKDSPIEWTTHTFNPWWGCVKVSPGCTNCYAEAWARRFGQNLWGPGSTRRTFGDDHWRQPLAWDRDAAAAGTRARVFCASMADVFELEGPEAERKKLWRLIEETPYLDWLLLTKRPENIARLLPQAWQEAPRPNVWLGTTVESPAYYRRIAALVSVRAAVRFLSLEPLIERLPGLPLAGIHWAIVGGESGPKARPMPRAWVVDLRAQCRAADVAFFFKQWGGRDKRATGRELDRRTYDELPAPVTSNLRHEVFARASRRPVPGGRSAHPVALPAPHTRRARAATARQKNVS